jgi:hypothetical protein
VSFAARQHLPAAAASGLVNPFTLPAVFPQGNAPTVTSTVTVNADGTISNDGTVIGNWYSPTTSGIGSGYRVRFTAVGDTFTGLTANTFYALSSARTVTYSAPPNYSGSSVLTIQIATSGSDTIVASGTLNLTITNFAE